MEKAPPVNLRVDLSTCQTVCTFACHVSDCVYICLPCVRLCVHLLAMCQTVCTFACHVSNCVYICLPCVKLCVHLLVMCQTVYICLLCVRLCVHLLAMCQTVCTFIGHVSDCGNTNTDYESPQGHVSDCGNTDTGLCVRLWQHGHRAICQTVATRTQGFVSDCGNTDTDWGRAVGACCRDRGIDRSEV